MAEFVTFADLNEEERQIVTEIAGQAGSSESASRFATPPSQILPETAFIKTTPAVFALTHQEAVSHCKEMEEGYGKGKNAVAAAQDLADTKCLISSKKGNKGKGDARFGYPKRKVGGVEGEVYWHHIGFLAGDDFETIGRTTAVNLVKRGYQFSHLCHQPRCFAPMHVILEPEADNRARNACKGVTWVRCPVDQFLFNPCPHTPQCILPMSPEEWGWESI